MSPSIKRQVAALERLTAGELKKRYAEVFGEPTRTRNRAWLQTSLPTIVVDRDLACVFTWNGRFSLMFDGRSPQAVTGLRVYQAALDLCEKAGINPPRRGSHSPV
jgi:hypothetical protein